MFKLITFIFAISLSASAVANFSVTVTPDTSGGATGVVTSTSTEAPVSGSQIDCNETGNPNCSATFPDSAIVDLLGVAGPDSTIELTGNSACLGTTCTGMSGGSGDINITAIMALGSGPLPPVITSPIPTLSFWGLLLLSSIIALLGFGAKRKD